MNIDDIDNVDELDKTVNTILKRKKKLKKDELKTRFQLDTKLRRLFDEMKENMDNDDLKKFVSKFKEVTLHIDQYRQEPTFDPNKYLLYKEQESIVMRQASSDIMGLEFPKNFWTFNEHNFVLGDKIKLPVGKNTILTGVSGIGKTTVALNMLLYYIHTNKRVLFFTGEQTVMELWFMLFKAKLGMLFSDKTEDIKIKVKSIDIFDLQLLYNEGKTLKRVDGELVTITSPEWKFVKEKMESLRITRQLIVDFIEKYQENLVVIESFFYGNEYGYKSIRNNTIVEILQAADVLMDDGKEFDLVFIDYIQLHKACRELEKEDEKTNIDKSSEMLNGFAYKRKVALICLAQLSKQDSKEFVNELKKIDQIDSRMTISVNAVSGSSKPVNDCSLFLTVFIRYEDGEPQTYLQVGKNRLTSYKGLIKLPYLAGFLGVKWKDDKKVD